MSHTYAVDFAVYDGSSSDQNPKVWVHGFVDGISSGYFAICWAGIQQAFVTNGTAGVQTFLAPILYKGVFGPPNRGIPSNDVSSPPIPQFSSSNIPPAIISGPRSIVVQQALVPPWSQ